MPHKWSSWFNSYYNEHIDDIDQAKEQVDDNSDDNEHIYNIDHTKEQFDDKSDYIIRSQ